MTAAVAAPIKSDATPVKLKPEAVRTWSREELLAALPEHVVPVRTSIGYLLALAVVAGVLVLLPVLYAGLTALVGYGVYWHFTHGQWMFDALGGGKVRGKGAILVVVAWLAPGIIGAILVLFMFKPLLRWRRYGGQRRTLSRDDEPLLYDYVDRLCDALGAPRPVRIDYDGQVNASASFASNGSFFTNRLVLTLGLPIVGGLSLRHLTGVMAHEFGHFSQFWAMRLGRVIEMVNDWFRRVVEERDHWDEKLDAAAGAVDLRIGWVLHLSQMFVWLVRKVLTGFRYVGLFFSRRLSRQMEFDADQYEVRIAGSRAFAQTFDRMAVLGIASQAADRGCDQFLREGKALDDYVKFVTYQVEELPRDKLVPLLEAMRNEPVPWTSTHPSNGERIAAGEQMDEAGVVTLQAPATVLFRDFSKLCREFTRSSYSRGDGAEVTTEELTSVGELIAEQRLRRARFEAARRFVMYADLALVRWGEDRGDLTSEDTDEALWSGIRAARKNMQEEYSGYRKAAAEWRAASATGTLLMAARLPVIFREKVDYRKQSLIGRKFRTIKEINDFETELNQRYETLRPRLRPFENACARRLRWGLILAIRTADAAKAAEIQRVWTAFQLLAPTPLLMEDHEPTLAQLEWIFGKIMKYPKDQSVRDLAMKITERGINEMNQIWGHLAEGQYPFELPYQTEHMSHALLSHFADSKNPFLVYGDLRRFSSGYWVLWRRVLGWLANLAEETEARAGLTPLLEAEPQES